ncbi:alpha-2-macroglobulin [Tenacibaculum sp. SG-28]|uniref:alpha-2-macroglobulin family protein n=1 Tax=Tenacibaculum sp. SG-28 TaxID=754426 RepID=UPI002100BCF6|nr:alpha-2-macroglobulin family protein [Tenacibaculum sp. SG-28]
MENGSEVLDHFWIPTKAQQTSFTFPILPSYSPNIYVSITLLQKHQNSVNDLPIRMYGTIPISVYDAKTKLQPEVKLPKELVPESTASIEVSEKNGKAMTYTIAVVDEGLLDLTRFKTPNPWNSFYAKQSLGVKTWDIYDDVIGAYGGKVHQILSIGGDESEAGSKNKKANRFEPMVRYLGPFQLAKGARKKHEITIPKYVGAVRAMVVASDNKNEAYGSTEKAVFVRKPVMVLASLPRKITPQETVTLPVTVFAMKPSVRAVNVTVKPDPSFTIIGTRNKKVSFTKPDEKMVYFTLKVNDFKGIGNVDILATSGKEKASYSVEIDVLNPNPISTEVHELVLQANESGTISFENFGTKGTNMASLELSTLPPMNFTKRLQYLVRYPHGCIEQSTSSAFPQLYFTDLFSLSKSKKADIDRNIKATVQRISNFQLSSGGLSYWQGDRNASNWGTSYAGHFMLEAAKKGYVLPIGFLSKWINYQKQEARNWRNTNSYRNNDLAQAYRLYTLCLANAPDLASMNRLREASNISNDARIQLAGAYALLGKQNIATSIVETLNEFVNRNDYSNTYGSELRNKAMALETYSLLNMDTKAIKAAKEISDSLSSETWMSTQTTAFCLLAISNYAIKNADNTGLKAVYTIGDRKENVTTSKALYTSDIKKLSTENTLGITNTNKGILYVRLFQQGILPVGEEKVVEKNLEIDVVYRNKNGKFITPDEIQQGTNFVAQITVKNTTNKEVENIALTQFLPSGWEVINTRFTGFSENTSASKTDYTDIRDASIRNYFRLKKFESKQFKVLLNASYLGNYYLPGLQAEGMYDNSYFARTKGKWITVIR